MTTQMTRKNIVKYVAVAMLLTSGMATAAAQNATLRIDARTTHQHITGFGGFVCSPQFAYGHMSNTEIEKVWGSPETSLGCNIMRLYIPIGKNSWGQSLATAKKAKQMGLIVFASPWGQPQEWKTNNSVNAKNSEGKEGHLKKTNWPDYAQYLEDYVQYLRKNGVELDAISIQNEPDWAATYAGCLWSTSEMAEFVKTYGRTISCKVMAPESLGVSDGYANALNKSDVIDCFDIYGGHQYGGLQSAYKNLGKKGKEIWMTEYLINWNEVEGNTRSFDFSKDFFNFFRAINTCMLGDFNAWVHYAAKRYYAMLGDGERGTTNSEVTKRGYIMAHFARYITGYTRIDAIFGGGLEGTAYLSQSGDTVVAVMANTGSKTTLTVDLPFYTTTGSLAATTRSDNMAVTELTPAETCRPVVEIPAQSVTTVRFVRSRDRQPSDMVGKAKRFDRLDDLTPTTNNFGTGYQLSGKTKTFDSSNPLISSRKNTNNGYIALNNRFDRLVMQVKKVTTTNQFTSGATTLNYVNAKGEASSHEYGRIDLSAQQNFDLVFDLSPATLTDGCIGLLSLTNDNATSHLSITFGDVYLSNSANYAATLSGAFVADDSNVLDYTSDAACTSIDLSAVTDLPGTLPWQATNRVYYAGEGSPLVGTNVVNGTVCPSLTLTEDGGDFRPAKPFTAETATVTMTINGLRLIMLPFHAIIPDGVRAYTIGDDISFVQMRSIPAHTPMLVSGNGTVTFSGSGDVAYSVTPVTAAFRGSYTSLPLYAGDYVLQTNNGQYGLMRLTKSATLPPFGVYARLDSSEAFIPFSSDIMGVEDMLLSTETTPTAYYDLQGRCLPSATAAKGLVIVRVAGKGYIKVMNKD